MRPDPRSCPQVTLSFPAVLDRLGLKAFDMSKLVDSFVRAEPGLLKEVRKHLFGVQERILDSLAWQRGSSLYTIMKLACQAPPQVCPRQSPDACSASGPVHVFLCGS